MFSKLRYLLKVEYLSQSSLNAFRHEKDPKKKHRLMGIFFAYIIVAAMFVGYSFIIGYGYGYLKMEDAIPGYALAISSIVVLFFTFIKTNGFLFAYRDYDILMSLPFSTQTVITGKFIYMYINNLLFSMAIMFPMGSAYAIWTKPDISVYIIWILITFFTPLVPMTIAAAVGALIAAIGSRFRFKVLVQAILSIIIVLAAISFSFIFNGSGSNAEFLNRMEDIGNILQNQIHKIYPLSILFDNAVNKNSFLQTIGFIAISIIIYIIFVYAVSIKYKVINTSLMTAHSSSNYKVKKMDSHSIMQALIWKEVKRFFSSITYLMNVGIGMILAVIGSAACVIIGIDSVLKKLNMGEMQSGFIYAVPFAIAMLVTMTCTTCVSLSLEGKNFWILQSLPIDQATIYKSKMAFNMILLTPASLICNICFIIVLKVDLITALLYIFTAFVTISFSTVMGMWIGINFVNFTWENEIEIIKQSMSSAMGIFLNMVLEIIIAGAAFFMSTIIDGKIVLLLISIIMGVLSLIIYKSVMRKKINI